MHPFRQWIEEMGLLGLLSNSKFIPDAYLFASPSDRLALLRGLMDTDGYIAEGGTCQYYSVSDRLASGVTHLIRSLGGIPTNSIKKTSYGGKVGQPCHVVTFSLATHNPFSLARKAVRWNSSPRDNGRWIDKIEFERRQPTVCISVDSSDSSYVTEHFIVTHNTPIQLVWAENVVRHTNRPVLILAPLAVAQQFAREAAKFDIEAHVSQDGKPRPNITIANYERLHKFNPDDYSAVSCDEASIVKHWSGATQKSLTRFMSKIQYRLLSTATAAPNADMLATFFRQISDDEKKKRATADDIINSKRLSWRVIQSIGQYAMKPHAFEPFWRWVASWARACRKPSDLGTYDDSQFVLPPLLRYDHEVTPRTPPPGYLFTIPAFGLNQERSERRRTLDERAELIAELTKDSDSAIVWCHLNSEGDRFEREIKGAVQVKGSQSLEEKEERILAFIDGQARVLVTKAKIAGLGLNLQHCAHVVTCVDHSFEKFYQCVRRCYRFGQTRPVRLDVIATEGEVNVRKNMDRKQKLSDQMFDMTIHYMNESQSVTQDNDSRPTEVPQWLAGTR